MKTRSVFRPAAVAFFLAIGSILLSPESAVAQSFALLDMDGKPANLETFRDDGKVTLLMVRYNECPPCDKTEIALQQWYANQDKSIVSVLGYNSDTDDKRADVIKRLAANNIQYPNFFSSDREKARADFQRLTGKAMRVVPSLIVMNPDGSVAGTIIGTDVDWDGIDDFISSRVP